MGTYYRTQARQYLNKPKDYTTISKKTGGNAGLGRRSVALLPLDHVETVLIEGKSCRMKDQIAA